jgi:hypothetical protein
MAAKETGQRRDEDELPLYLRPRDQAPLTENEKMLWIGAGLAIVGLLFLVALALLVVPKLPRSRTDTRGRAQARSRAGSVSPAL